jgi:transposase
MAGVAYVPFKTNSVLCNTPPWDRMLHHFLMLRDEFLARYHKGSNIESTFSAIRRAFGDSLRSRNDAAMVNEALAKIVGFNLTCVIQEWYKLGIDPTDFGMPAPAEREPSSILRFPR